MIETDRNYLHSLSRTRTSTHTDTYAHKVKDESDPPLAFCLGLREGFIRNTKRWVKSESKRGFHMKHKKGGLI